MWFSFCLLSCYEKLAQGPQGNQELTYHQFACQLGQLPFKSLTVNQNAT